MRTTRRWQVILVSAWVLSIAGGAGYLAAHGARAGDTGVTPSRWEPGAIERTPGVWTIVLAAHPRCPCTRASADELVRALAGADKSFELIVLAFCPAAGAGADHAGFADTPILRRLGSLNHARIVADPGGRLAAGFGALTSGHALLYDPAGRLRFSGGLTPTRAHVGPNTGSAALRSLLRGEAAAASASPVYGCPLDNTTAARAVDLGGCAVLGESACTP